MLANYNCKFHHYQQINDLVFPETKHTQTASQIYVVGATTFDLWLEAQFLVSMTCGLVHANQTTFPV